MAHADDHAAAPSPRRKGFLFDYLGRRWGAVTAPVQPDDVTDRAVWTTLDFLYRRYWRVNLEGVEHLPRKGKALLVVNHGGCLPWDALMLMHGVQEEHPAHRAVHPLMEDAFFRIPFVGQLLLGLGALPTQHSHADQLLARGELVAVFPEGAQGLGKPFWNRYRLKRFGRGGFARIALQTGAPIIPVAVVGPEETNPVLFRGTWLGSLLGLPCLPITATFPWLGPLGLVPLPTKWTIRMGPRIPIPVQESRRVDDPAAMQALAETVRSHLQSMVDDVRKSRRHVMLG